MQVKNRLIDIHVYSISTECKPISILHDNIFHFRSFFDSICSHAGDRRNSIVLSGACHWTAPAQRIGGMLESGVPLPAGRWSGLRRRLLQCGAVLQHDHGMVHHLPGAELPEPPPLVPMSLCSGTQFLDPRPRVPGAFSHHDIKYRFQSYIANC